MKRYIIIPILVLTLILTTGCFNKAEGNKNFTIKKQISNIDRYSSFYVPLEVNNLKLTNDNILLMDTYGKLKESIGENVIVKKNVKNFYVLKFGNGGYRSIIMINDNDTVSAVNMTKLIQDKKLSVMNKLGGYQDVKRVKSSFDGMGNYVFVVLSNNEEYPLDMYLK